MIEPLFWGLPTSGVVVAASEDGEILAMVSYPSYENNRMSLYRPTTNQLVNDPTTRSEPCRGRRSAGRLGKLVTSTGA
jgi:cell division protein FtsI/penicillin-binding protein 2